MDSQATAGRIVHYIDATGRAVASIVNRDVGEDGVAQLTTFYEAGPVPMRSVPYSEEPDKGCWSWMPYQKAKAEAPNGNQSESAEPRSKAYLDTKLDRIQVETDERFEDLKRAVNDLQASAMTEDVEKQPESAPESVSLPPGGQPETAPPLEGTPTTEGGPPAA